ncbi:hypothetical protein BDN72DRAFT_838956 [Pluteus cervinus]|uniref:Uncharacterized protein n=1 Tax=Pluteus cervinus TaxID=181527 RepID=A0ACD3AXV2_9AGAR|nr:hypothetical protein BDN72DRAFT_838956 [Pluteus cervinus]
MFFNVFLDNTLPRFIENTSFSKFDYSRDHPVDTEHQNRNLRFLVYLWCPSSRTGSLWNFTCALEPRGEQEDIPSKFGQANVQTRTCACIPHRGGWAASKFELSSYKAQDKSPRAHQSQLSTKSSTSYTVEQYALSRSLFFIVIFGRLNPYKPLFLSRVGALTGLPICSRQILSPFIHKRHVFPVIAHLWLLPQQPRIS